MYSFFSATIAAEMKVARDLCYNRLAVSQCRWDGCSAVLESAKRSGMHARTHVSHYDDADEAR